MSLLPSNWGFTRTYVLPWVCFLILACCLPAACGAPADSMAIGRLTAPFVVDGDVSEWSAAVGVPMMAESDILALRESHKRSGEGALFLCAWSSEGLCVAAVVSDSDVRNTRQPGDYWQQDCVEFMVDGRTGRSFGMSPYSRGAYQILVRPPVDGKPADASLNPRDGNIDGLRVAGKKTATGYTIEMLVPWSAFPGFKPKPGAKFGLHFALDDSDTCDGEINQPMQMMFRSALWAPQCPESIAKWELTDACPMGNSAVSASTEFDVPNIEYKRKQTLSFHLFIAQPLSKNAESVRFELLGKDGKSHCASTVPLNKVSDAVSGVLGADFSCASKDLPDGDISAMATLLDHGKSVAVVTRTMLDCRPH